MIAVSFHSFQYLPTSSVAVEVAVEYLLAEFHTTAQRVFGVVRKGRLCAAGLDVSNSEAWRLRGG